MEGGKDADKGPAMYGSSPALAQKHKAGGLGGIQAKPDAPSAASSPCPYNPRGTPFSDLDEGSAW